MMRRLRQGSRHLWVHNEAQWSIFFESNNVTKSKICLRMADQRQVRQLAKSKTGLFHDLTIEITDICDIQQLYDILNLLESVSDPT